MAGLPILNSQDTTIVQQPQARSKPNVINDNYDVITFRGLNKLPRIDKGELRSMKNLHLDSCGCLVPRPQRSYEKSINDGRFFFITSGGKNFYAEKDTGTTYKFYYDNVYKTSSTLTDGEKCVVEFAPYILIFPDKKYYNYNTNELGNIGTGTYPAAGSCPDIKYACVHNNRVWGVGGQGIYASKFKDPFTWTEFSVPVIETDSVYFEIDSKNGEMTGIIPLENHIVITTNKSIFELYGNKPSNFVPRLITNSSGCISHKSLVEIDGRVFMLNKDGINAYGGSFPKPISAKLNEKYVSGVAVAFNRKYYISLYNGTDYSLYIFDTTLGCWYKEDSLQVLDFAVLNDYIYALTGSGTSKSLYALNKINTSSPENISWEFELSRLTEEYMGMKGTSKIKVEAELESGSTLSVYVRNDGGSYRLLNTFNTSGYQYLKVHELPQNAFWFQIKIAGTGDCKIYSITRQIIVNSDIG
jgi:hypothetical protein